MDAGPPGNQTIHTLGIGAKSVNWIWISLYGFHNIDLTRLCALWDSFPAPTGVQADFGEAAPSSGPTARPSRLGEISPAQPCATGLFMGAPKRDAHTRARQFLSKREFQPNRQRNAESVERTVTFGSLRVEEMPMLEYNCENFHDSPSSSVSVPGIA